MAVPAARLMLLIGLTTAWTASGDQRSRPMLYYALVFLIVGLIAGALGVAGVAAVASQIAWVLFVIGIVLLLVHLVSGRRQSI